MVEKNIFGVKRTLAKPDSCEVEKIMDRKKDVSS